MEKKPTRPNQIVIKRVQNGWVVHDWDESNRFLYGTAIWVFRSSKELADWVREADYKTVVVDEFKPRGV